MCAQRACPSMSWSVCCKVDSKVKVLVLFHCGVFVLGPHGGVEVQPPWQIDLEGKFTRTPGSVQSKKLETYKIWETWIFIAYKFLIILKQTLIWQYHFNDQSLKWNGSKWVLIFYSPESITLNKDNLFPPRHFHDSSSSI